MTLKIKRCKVTMMYFIAYYDGSIHGYIHLDDKFFKKYKEAKEHFYSILRRLQESDD